MPIGERCQAGIGCSSCPRQSKVDKCTVLVVTLGVGGECIGAGTGKRLTRAPRREDPEFTEQI